MGLKGKRFCGLGRNIRSWGGGLFFLLWSGVIFASKGERPLCTPGKWAEKPLTESGEFIGRFQVECLIQASSSPLLLLTPYLKQRIQAESLSFSEGPSLLAEDRTKRLQFQIKRHPPGEPTLTLEEEVILAEEGSFFSTHSLKATGTGLNSYVRGVDFRADFEFLEDQKVLRVKNETTLRVERPWYSPGPLFYPIVESQAHQKLDYQMNQWAKDLQNMISNHFSTPSP